MTIEDFITGEKFAQIADFIFTPNILHQDDFYQYKNTFDIDKVINFDGRPIVYTHTYYVGQLFDLVKDLDKEIILVTHNSDMNIYDTEIPQNVFRWYAQNVCFSHPKLFSIPIGLENNMWFRDLNKKGLILDKIKKTKKTKNLLYINHNINTNIKERQKPYDLFKDKNYATMVYGKNGHGFKDYLDNLYNHKFIIVPDGNGVDTHRLWESLYLGSIPIVKNNFNNEFYKDLPICFIKDWEEVNEDFLNDQYNRISKENYNLEKLKFSFWRDEINKNKN